MKKVCFFLFWGFIFSNRSFCQNFPLVKEMFALEVGDTFEYHTNYSPHYDLIIVSNKVQYGSDSMVVTFHSFTKDDYGFNPQVNESYYNRTIRYLDSSFLYLYHNSQWPIADSLTSLTISGGDTIYENYKYYTIHGCYDSNNQNYYSQSMYRQLKWISGFGEIINSETVPCSMFGQGVITLIYAHKTNGVVYGTPEYSMFTGVEDILNAKNSSLFPNPTNQAFQVQLSKNPIESTFFKLFDAIGREAKRELITNTATTLQRDNLPNGIYFWQLEQEGKILDRGKVVFE